MTDRLLTILAVGAIGSLVVEEAIHHPARQGRTHRAAWGGLPAHD